MKETIINLAKKYDADLIGFAPAERFSADDPIFRLLPGVKTVIGLGFRVLRGAYRGIEEGSTYYQYTTMGVENLEETVMPVAMMQVAVALEEEGFTALPQKRHQLIMDSADDINPEMDHHAIFHNVTAETQMDFDEAAVKCGLGERGLHGALLCDEFGPFIRTCFILTDAEFEPTPVYAPHLCDGCGECVKGCPGHALSADGKRDNWRCAVYYQGANGTKNPFMSPDAYSDFDDRVEIIAGEAGITPEKARAIIDATIFYPPIKHSYPASICGRACDMACYCHLEEKGLLTRKFKTPFRTREPWKFDIEDFGGKKQ
ncbi:MAG: hypothetical protein IJ493_08030 [Clostridia bacterium]|nr:hypothetical protein [Clostridia bacterium]